MLHSMTAFGRGEAEADGYSFTVELRSVNHRFCDIQVKVPRRYSRFEEEIRKRLSASFSRGRIEVSILADEALEKVQHLTVDRELTETYTKLLRNLQEELELEGGLSLEVLLNFRDIFVFEEHQEGQQQAWRVLQEAIDQAIVGCLQMRANEGSAIAADLENRLDLMAALVGEVKERTPLVVQEARDRLHERVRLLLGETDVDEARLAQEVAFFADRSDVTEELIRLQSHIQQFRELLSGDGARGRQLEFVLQEMHREINTIGSKANDLIIAQKVIQVKTELERVREQVQNVE